MENVKIETFLKKFTGSNKELSVFSDGTFQFYQENLDNAAQKAVDCPEFSKNFFMLCKEVKKENGVTLYRATDPNLTGIDGLCPWEEGYNKGLHDLYINVFNYFHSDTFLVCEESGYCIAKQGRDTSRSSLVARFV